MIPFNKPYYSGNELAFIQKAMETNMLTGDQEVVRLCEAFLEKKFNFKKVFLTNSCTMALEIAAVVAGIQPSDEVIIPSFTYVSTANAFELRGAKIVFADSSPDHPNIDISKIESLITSKTKAFVVMHYAGNACDIDEIKVLAKKHKLLVIEDAAQCINSFYKDQALGSIGDLGCFSFHETKNIHCGEGGFIAINNPDLIERAEIVRNKGTNRSAFIKGEVSKYEWVDVGFSSLPTTMTAAFLFAQLEQLDVVQKKRIELWNVYAEKLSCLKNKGVQLPFITANWTNNAHIFYLIVDNENERNALIKFLKGNNIQAVFHYQTLHDSPYFKSKHDGRKLSNANKYSNCLVRLPLYFDLTISEVENISNKILEYYSIN